MEKTFCDSIIMLRFTETRSKRKFTEAKEDF